jgi:hypothetical protein
VRLNEIKAYFVYYGFEVKDEARFQELMLVLIAAAKDAAQKVDKFREGERFIQLLQYEKTYNGLKEDSKDEAGCVNWQKSKSSPTKYIMFNRVITPLLIATETVVESPLPADLSRSPAPAPASSSDMKGLGMSQLTSGECEKLQECFQKLTIEAEAPDFTLARKHSRSLRLKRSYMEMQKVDVAPESILTVRMLKAVFAYLDYESGKFSSPQHIIIGQLVTLIYEVPTSYISFRRSAPNRPDESAGCVPWSLHLTHPPCG